MTPEQTENLKKLAEAARLDSLYWWPVDELEDSNIILDKDDAAYIAAASPDVVLALIAENEALVKDAARLKSIAWIIGSIYVHGNFIAETANERELERLLRENGTFWETLTDFDAAMKGPTP